MRQERYQWQPARRTYIPKKQGRNAHLVCRPGRTNRGRGDPHRSWMPTTTHIQRPLPRFPSWTRMSYCLKKSTTTGREPSGSSRATFPNASTPRSRTAPLDAEKSTSTMGVSSTSSKLLDAGYLEDWKFNRTLSGVPQGSIVESHPFQYPARQVGQICRNRLDPTVHQRG